MFIKSYLFSKGAPFMAEAGLRQVLEAHTASVLKKIKSISDVDQMTDSFLENLVKESLVEPLSIHFDKMTKKRRNDQLDGSMIPRNSVAGRMLLHGDFDESEVLAMGGREKQMVRLSIPFTGDPVLLQFAPDPCGVTFPRGEVADHTIQFDEILWSSSPEDARRLKDGIKNNRDLIATYAAAINRQVKAFNESLPERIKTAFVAKLEELTKQYAILDDLGIPDEEREPEPTRAPTGAGVRPPKRRKTGGQIIQYVANQYVQQLNQTNYNVGDVNNAIQSDEQ